MRKIITTVLTVATLALPIVDASAATKAAKKKIVVTKKFAGSVASVDRWGDLQVTIVVRKTTTTVTARRRSRGS